MGSEMCIRDRVTTIHGGSYGIGVSRLVGAVIEACHDENGIIWPKAIAPYDVGLISMRPNDDSVSSSCEAAYAALAAAGLDTLYDETGDRAGAKFARMDLIGLPWQIIIGPKGVEKGVVELKERATGERQELPLDEAIQKIKATA